VSTRMPWALGARSEAWLVGKLNPHTPKCQDRDITTDRTPQGRCRTSRFNDRIGPPSPPIPRSDDNKDAMIRPGTFRFPYAETAERAPLSCLFLGDRRRGEGRTVSLPRSRLTIAKFNRMGHLAGFASKPRSDTAITETFQPSKITRARRLRRSSG